MAMRDVLGAAVVLGALAAPVAAGNDTAAIRKVLDAQVKAISRHDGPAFAATFAPTIYAMLPGGYATSASSAGKGAARGWWGADMMHVTAKARVAKAVIGQAGERAWITADLTLSEVSAEDGSKGPDEAYRVTELLVRQKGAWKVHATYWSQAVPDEPGAWANTILDGDDGMPDGDPTPGNGAPGAAWAAKPADLAAHLRGGKDVVVLGSAPRERGEGPAAATLLAGWKRIAFDVDWLRAGGDGTSYAWVAGRISRGVKDREQGTIHEPYWMMVLLVKGASDWEVVSAHYGQTSPAAGLEHGDGE
ncbi:MAG: nuclear transport factor 2 family protein [Deltaproteobacteria bacterium]|nr:nuclear transport factor 2 family protein [Deltaproteobacteria bacterium]